MNRAALALAATAAGALFGSVATLIALLVYRLVSG